MLTYRPDIDGLRAIAVLAVVLYHADPTWLPGGFVGVDIFFVISGYLITKIIAGEIEQGRFSLMKFYVRRAKRILPALFVVLAATFLLSLALLTPSELRNLGDLMVATVLFVSNFMLWQESGYFDIAAERKPLLHTWSLAVEEQFYVLWPLALLLVLPGKRVPMRTLFVVVALGSFLLSCYGVVRQPAAAFFLLPTRAWELLLGAALALGLVRPIASVAWRNVATFAGALLIGGAVLLLDRNSAFPGWNALAPCLGAALLIHAGDKGDALVSRYVLMLKPMVFVGLISYSLYLWHWPLLSLARISQRGELTHAAVWTILGGAFVLSVLTWRYVENRFRRAPAPASARTLGRYALASVMVGIIGGITIYSSGFAAWARPELGRTETARWDANPLGGACLKYPAQAPTLPGDECRTPSATGHKQMVIWGDSHADAVAPGVVAYAAARGLGTYQLTMAICPPLIGIELAGAAGNYAGCPAFNDAALRFIRANPDVETVVLAARWAVYTELSRFGREDPGPVVRLIDRERRSSADTSSRLAFVHGLERTVRALRAAGKKVVVLGQVPEIGTNVPNCLARNYLPLSPPSECSVEAERVRQRLDFSNTTIARLDERPGVCTFLPSEALCTATSCRTTADNVILYKDDDHLSVAGAKRLAQRFDFGACMPAAGSRTGIASAASVVPAPLGSLR